MSDYPQIDPETLASFFRADRDWSKLEKTTEPWLALLGSMPMGKTPGHAAIVAELWSARHEARAHAGGQVSALRQISSDIRSLTAAIEGLREGGDS